MLIQLLRSPLADAVGWTIIHSIWEGAILAAVLGAVLLITQSPRARYAAACTAMLVQVLACTLTLTYLSPSTEQQVATVSVTGIPSGLLHTPLQGSGQWDFQLAALAPWLTLLWITGVAMFSLRSFAGFLSVARLRRRGVCCAGADWQARLSALSAKLRLSRTVQLIESCFADTPVVIGHLRPVILVPLGMLTGYPAAQVEAILLHELAHIRRHDYLVNAIQRALEGLFFYHPAVWWVSAVIRAEREKCCDDIAVAVSGNAREYAAVLTALEEKRWTAAEPALAITGGSLMNRIRRLLYPQAPKAAWTPVLAAVICLLTIAFGLGAWQSDAADPSAAHMERLHEFAMFLSNSLGSNAAYTLADVEEREAYMKLTTDEERHNFLMQFWLRRNPGMSVQDLHPEIDRRLTYADQHFQTTAGLPGSQTDRGRMYVIYGAPDEIESHPNDGKEEWAYHRLQGNNGMKTFTFVDSSRTGEYRLVQQQGLARITTDN
jgi:GWxTD domain-containing protein